MNGIATRHDVAAIDACGMPPDLPASTYAMIRAGADIDPCAPALSFFADARTHRDVRRWTYRELLRDITRTANLFVRLGVRADSVIAYVLPNLPETHFVIWGGQAAGIVCAINPLLDARAIADLLNASRASVLVTLGPCPGFDLWEKVSSIVDDVESLAHLVQVNPARDARGGPGNASGAPASAGSAGAAMDAAHGRSRIALHDFDAAIACESGTALAQPRTFAPGDMSSFFCTGGTTGLPKIAMRSHGNEVANAWSAARFLGDSIGPGKTIFCGLPLFHVNAAMVTGLLPFSRGAHVVLGTPQGYRGEGVIGRFWEIVAHHRINFFSAVPTLYAALLDVPVGDHAIGSLEYGLCGAAPLPVEVLRAFQEKTGIRILEGYGLTEATCVSSVNPPLGERRAGSIGLSVPLQTMKAVVLDAAGRYLRDCAAGEEGSIVIAGPNVFAGYTDAALNERLWIDLGDGRRWLDTGDLGRQDAEGYFWLTGRRKDLIIRGGHNIDPATIEEPLHRHPAVQLAAAIGRPDARAGEVPMAYVQLKPGARASEQELEAFARQHIAERAAQPKQIRIVDAIPLTGVGKIFKPELKRRETGDALSVALAENGVAGASVDVQTGGSGGMTVVVTLRDAQFEAAAHAVLGRYPFTFTVDVQPQAH
ncbi:acyl-CoA synthetase [Burkholderia sp. AU19243]|uniref:acyl-CoA synthetase n=1 Tax=Burkholderia sp. AU19243 TaxID=2824810 RepID=UPI001BA0063A|nr:acyl-CoA synthetase [Burkholderia sp. AU19243]MBR8145670.1 acyl-CoA synthetase [Burkholderia vietnamiensis]MBR8366991.1 acyl-CoA synthetase [Burkholderia sp. AU19243]